MGQPRSRNALSIGFFAAVLATAAFVDRASATVVAARTPAELARRADAVVVARVARTGVRVELHDGHPVPTTRTTLEVERVLRGTAPHRLVIRELGGVAPTGALVVEGTPGYQEGQRVVAFLERREDAYRTFGFAMGKWSIRRAPDGREVAEQDLHGIVLLDREKGAALLGEARAIPLAELEREITGR